MSGLFYKISIVNKSFLYQKKDLFLLLYNKFQARSVQFQNINTMW